MANSARSVTALLRATRPGLCPTRAALSRGAFRGRSSYGRQFKRCYAEGPAPTKGGNNTLLIGAIAATAVGGAAFYFKDSFGASGVPITQTSASAAGQTQGAFAAKQEDYQKVYDAIAKKLVEEDDYDDGSYGPVLLRLGWHASGTFDAATGTGGSNGATMRFAPEGDHGANAGLLAARDFLAPIKAQFPWITYSDLWTLAAVAAIQEMQGPTIKWRPGRQDRDVSYCTPDGRLPDASKDQVHIRAIFNRMGFNDQEIVALSGAHALGRCHTDRSGFTGPWTFSPTTLTNDYYKLLMDEKWSYKKWDGPLQFEDMKTKSLMMLPTDTALIKDKSFKKHVERYAKDNDVFFREFSDVICKLFELGVPFKSGEESRMALRRSE